MSTSSCSWKARKRLVAGVSPVLSGNTRQVFRFTSLVKADEKETIGHIDAVLLSNSTWIDEADPCVVFGMRGVIYANLAVSSKGHDAHSGVDGGAVEEPMLDMVKILDAISDRQGVKVPGFCES